jgi:hypothetical protein
MLHMSVNIDFAKDRPQTSTMKSLRRNVFPLVLAIVDEERSCHSLYSKSGTYYDSLHCLQ